MKPEASVYSSLGGLFFNTGRIEEAKLAFKSGLELEPNRTDILCSYVSSWQGEQGIEIPFEGCIVNRLCCLIQRSCLGPESGRGVGVFYFFVPVILLL